MKHNTGARRTGAPNVTLFTDEHGDAVVRVEITQNETVVLNADDWERVSEQYGSLWIAFSDGRGRHYVGTHRPGSRKGKGGRHVITMQRAIMDAEPGERVFFVSRDRFDCRRRNLSLAWRSERLAEAA